MENKIRIMRLASATLALLCLAVLVGQARAQGDKMAEIARQITELAGSRGGLAVHYGCGDGGLIFALGRDDSRVVQGLSRDAQHRWTGAAVRSSLGNRRVT